MIYDATPTNKQARSLAPNHPETLLCALLKSVVMFSSYLLGEISVRNLSGASSSSEKKNAVVNIKIVEYIPPKNTVMAPKIPLELRAKLSISTLVKFSKVLAPSIPSC